METKTLRQQFEEETGMHWENSQKEPDIDYVIWLEKRLSASSQNRKVSDEKLYDEIENIFDKHTKPTRAYETDWTDRAGFIHELIPALRTLLRSSVEGKPSVSDKAVKDWKEIWNEYDEDGKDYPSRPSFIAWLQQHYPVPYTDKGEAFCTGCGRSSEQPLGLNKNGEPFLACCPDSNYKSVSDKEDEAVELKGALTELVKLKEYKDRIGKDEHYEAEQPKVWERARKALNSKGKGS